MSYKVGDRVKIAEWADFREWNINDVNPFDAAKGAVGIVSDVIGEDFCYYVCVPGINEPVYCWDEELCTVSA